MSQIGVHVISTCAFVLVILGSGLCADQKCSDRVVRKCFNDTPMLKNNKCADQAGITKCVRAAEKECPDDDGMAERFEYEVAQNHYRFYQDRCNGKLSDDTCYEYEVYKCTKDLLTYDGKYYYFTGDCKDFHRYGDQVKKCLDTLRQTCLRTGFPSTFIYRANTAVAKFEYHCPKN